MLALAPAEESLGEVAARVNTRLVKIYGSGETMMPVP